ncbi:LysR family transcriptional regulator [Nocardia alba]|uniref:DNA-binding transcriptional LysR family regulator n=1 Tax=Nocardia alba TaxID=225051 RepID=A0A4R1FT13_9NOCA|nr:LysR family transcriptional regulator [Nocardia alba]TCJ95628.1 DNA-binding transcriptional LysR family regulator [Nocardia alba]
MSRQAETGIPDLRRMMFLCDLAELGTVVAVAERRNITSSAVSQQLRVLEDEIGMILFRRDGRTFGLTRGGEVLVEHVRHVLAAVDEAVSAVAATGKTVAGRITVSGFTISIPGLIAPMVQRLSRDVPDLRTRVLQIDTVPAVRALRRGELDLAITCWYHFGGGESLAGLVSEEIMVDPIVLLAPERLHRRVRMFGLAALAEEPWITAPPGGALATAAARAAEAAGFTMKVAHRMEGAQNVAQFAASEVASAMVPLLAVPPGAERLIVDGLDLGGRSICATYREGRQRDPNIRATLHVLRGVVADRSALPARPDELGAAS